uniref:Uncharacterized protein n=1 Tax=Anguilla anguilla TaxID=7936 RepID=A0A0E9VJT4_ANGAN
MYRVTSQKIIINCLSHRGVVSIEKRTCIYKRYLSKQNPHTKSTQTYFFSSVPHLTLMAVAPIP